MEGCVFCRIVRGELPSRKVYEDEEVVAFHDINPAAPVHFMLVPKEHLESLQQVEGRHAGLLGRLLALAPKLAGEQGCRDGFRTIINTGRSAGQEVPHLHLHVIGGKPLPPMLVWARGA